MSFLEKHILGKKRTVILLALLSGPLVGLIVTSLKWSVLTLAEFLVMVSDRFSPLTPTMDFSFFLLIGALLMGVFLRLGSHFAGPGFSYASCFILGKRGDWPWYSLPLKFFGTTICVGTGGGGLVGPSYFIGTSTSVLLSKMLGLWDGKSVQFLAQIGASAGVSAVLKSPISGTLLVLESLIHKGERVSTLKYTVPSLLASLGAYLTMGTLLGFSPLLHLEGPAPINWSPATLTQLVTAGLFAGFSAKIYIELFRVMERVLRGDPPLWYRPALGAILALPIVILLSTGSSSAIQPFEIGKPGLSPLQDVLWGKLGFWAIIRLTIGKAIDVALRSGSGGSLGTFGPSMWIGGLSGGLTCSLTLFNSTPSLTIVGVSAGVAAAMDLPLTATIMVVEIFGPRMVAPSIIGSVTGILVLRALNHLKQESQ